MIWHGELAAQATRRLERWAREEAEDICVVQTCSPEHLGECTGGSAVQEDKRTKSTRITERGLVEKVAVLDNGH